MARKRPRPVDASWNYMTTRPFDRAAKDADYLAEHRDELVEFYAGHFRRFRAELERVPRSLAYAFAVATFDDSPEWRAIAEPLLAAALEQEREWALHDPREILRGP